MITVGRKAAPVVMTACAQCGGDFSQKPYMRRAFCSRTCFYASGRGGRKPGPVVALACDTCGRAFSRRECDVKAERSTHGHAGVYCSRPCYLQPKLTAEEARRRAYAITARWRVENRERVQAYKRAAYRRAEAADDETRSYVEIIRRDPCAYCGGLADTVDHIVPISAGGRNHWSNLAPACRSCNSGKKDHSLLVALLR
jgi:5-methylcytosine-specific restriction endonuclease McrA